MCVDNVIMVMTRFNMVFFNIKWIH